MSFLFGKVPDYDGLAASGDLFHPLDEVPVIRGTSGLRRPASQNKKFTGKEKYI